MNHYNILFACVSKVETLERSNLSREILATNVLLGKTGFARDRLAAEQTVQLLLKFASLSESVYFASTKSQKIMLWNVLILL